MHPVPYIKCEPRAEVELVQSSPQSVDLRKEGALRIQEDPLVPGVAHVSVYVHLVLHVQVLNES